VVYSAVDRKPTHFTGNIGANTGQYSFMGHNAGNTKLLGYISLKIKVISLKTTGTQHIHLKYGVYGSIGVRSHVYTYITWA